MLGGQPKCTRSVFLNSIDAAAHDVIVEIDGVKAVSSLIITEKSTAARNGPKALMAVFIAGRDVIDRILSVLWTIVTIA